MLQDTTAEIWQNTSSDAIICAAAAAAAAMCSTVETILTALPPATSVQKFPQFALTVPNIEHQLGHELKIPYQHGLKVG